MCYCFQLYLPRPRVSGSYKRHFEGHNTSSSYPNMRPSIKPELILMTSYKPQTKIMKQHWHHSHGETSGRAYDKAPVIPPTVLTEPSSELHSLPKPWRMRQKAQFPLWHWFKLRADGPALATNFSIEFSLSQDAAEGRTFDSESKVLGSTIPVYQKWDGLEQAVHFWVPD